MSNCYVAQLTDRAVVRVKGEAAGSFLQGMITNDINKVSDATPHKTPAQNVSLKADARGNP